MPDIAQSLKVVHEQRGIGSMEVIVVDSGSTDGSIAAAKSFQVRLEQVPSESFHHGRTRNFAATLARGQILVFLSQDAIPTSDRWLETMLSNFDDPTVGAVYGRQIPKPGSSLERDDVLEAIYGRDRIIKDPSHPNGSGYRFYHFSDVNAAIRQSVWSRVRFPEELRVFEDLGIAKRILDSGWKIVYEPASAVFHSHSHTAVGLFKRYFDIGYTLQVLRIWDSRGVRESLVRDFGRLLQKKLRRGGSKETNRAVGSAVRQELLKSAGFLLGLNHAYLPLTLKRRLSAHQIFQQDKSDSH